MDYVMKTITSENKDDYMEILNPDKIEDIGRLYHRGIALHDEKDMSVKAALVWELSNVHNEKDITSEILDFYMAETVSGRQIIEQYKKMAMEEDVKKTIFELPFNWEDLRIGVIREAGFELREKESREVSITVEEVAKIPIMEKNLVTPYILNFGNISLQQFRKGITNCYYCKRTGYMEDLVTLPISWYEPNLSCCVLVDGIVSGFLLIHKTVSGKLSVKIMLGFEKADRMDLFRMIQFAVQKAKEHYPPETEIVVKCCDEDTRALVEKLFQKKKCEMVIAGKLLTV